MNQMKRIHLLSLILVWISISCDSFLDIDPPRDEIGSDIVFNDDLTATAAVLKLYTRLESSGLQNVTLNASLSSDELMLNAGIEPLQFYENNIQPENTRLETLWRTFYTLIYDANAIIEGIEQSNGLSSGTRDQLRGEALFFRTFGHFYLTNLFGDIPYIAFTDYRLNGLSTRMPVGDVYNQCIADLQAAKSLLIGNYSHANNERVRVNKWVASALLARVYLYQEDWTRAEEQATVVINQNSLYTLQEDINAVFLKNNSEVLLQLLPNSTLSYTREGAYFNSGFYTGLTTLSQSLVDALEPGDPRASNWVNFATAGANEWYHPYKYKEGSANGTGAEYTCIIRLAEIYLIRAEARAMQNKLVGSGGAEFDINKIRNRAGLPNISVSTQQDYLLAIEQERRVELFTEWGHRWFDLKRTGRASAVLQPIKPRWQDTDMLYPIPFSELQLNPNLTQNYGY